MTERDSMPTDRSEKSSDPITAGASPTSAADKAASVVLLIHGTAAGDASDSGERWWQRDSHFWAEMNRALAPHAQCGPADASVFHWDEGPNSERRRREAGRRLYQWLLEIDESGIPFHVVAHSHGGSITWHALTESISAKRPLKNLATWTTVGTPFLHYSVDWRPLVLLAPMGAAAGAAFASMWRVERLKAAWSAMLADAQGTAIASLIGLWTVVAVALVLSLTAVVRVLYAWFQTRHRAAHTAPAWETYGTRWLGVGSPQDEAINGLSSTLGFRGDIVPRATAWRSSATARAFSALLAPFRFFYNRVFPPLADQFVWERVVRRLQGTDIAATRLHAVTRGPVPEAAAFGLSAQTNEEVLELANRESARTVASVREALSNQSAKPDLPGLLGQAQKTLSWNELIHNSYFAVSSVRQIVIERIRGHYSAIHRELRPEPSLPASAVVATRAPGLLVPTSLAIALTIGTVGALVMANVLFDKSVATYSDEYQIESVITEVPLTEASENGTRGDEDLASWADALMDAGYWKEAIAVAGGFRAAVGPVAAGLLMSGRESLLSAMLTRPEFSSAEVDCHLSSAMGLLLTRPDKASQIVDRIATRQRSRDDSDEQCSASISAFETTEHVSSPAEALEYARVLLARAQARSGASHQEVLAVIRAISSEQHRGAAFRQTIEHFVDRAEPEKALSLYRAAPAGTYFDNALLARISGALEKLGRESAASEVAAVAIASLSTAPDDSVEKLIQDFAASGAVKGAFDLAAKGDGDDAWLVVATALADSGDFANAWKASTNVSPQGYPIFEVLAVAALRRKNLKEALKFYDRARKRERSFYADKLAESFAELGAVNEAIGAARRSSDLYWDLSKVVDKLSDTTKRLQALDAFAESLDGAVPRIRLYHLPTIIDGLVQLNRKEAAASIAKALVATVKEVNSAAKQYPGEHYEQYKRAVLSLCRAGFVDEAIAAYYEAPRTSEIHFNLDPAEIIECLARAGRLDEAMAWQERTRDEPSLLFGSRFVIGTKLPPQKARAGDFASKLIQRKLSADAAIYLARSGLREEAYKIIGNLPKGERDDVMNVLLDEYLNANDAEGALSAAASIEDSTARSDALFGMARTFADNGQVRASCDAARALTDAAKRTAALLRCVIVAEAKDSREARIALIEALTSAQRILDDTDRMSYVASVAIELSKRGYYREARLACATCFAALKLSVYTAMVDAYAKRQGTARPRWNTSPQVM